MRRGHRCHSVVPGFCPATYRLLIHLDRPHWSWRSLEMGGWDRLWDQLQVSIPAFCALLPPSALLLEDLTYSPFFPALDSVPSDLSYPPPSGTGGQTSQTTGMGTGWVEVRTVPTLTIMASGMITSARGPTAGSVKAAWASLHRSVWELLPVDHSAMEMAGMGEGYSSKTPLTRVLGERNKPWEIRVLSSY